MATTANFTKKRFQPRWLFAISIGALSMALSGCLSPSMTGGSSTAGTVIDSFPICPGNQRKPYAKLITSSSELSAFYSQAATIDDSLNSLPQVNFSSASVILVGYGEKPSSGYQLNFLNSNQVTKSGNDIEMTITTVEPDSNAAVATVMTSPCVLVETNKVSPNTKVRVYSQDKRFFARN